jgi:mono/diheme cytochrome c family protein
MLLFVLLAAPAAAASDPIALGRQVLLEQAEPRCGACHTLADAKAIGQVGPSLDELKPDAGRVKAAVQNGIGVMPAFNDLTSEQVEAVSAYVAAVAGKAR